MLMKLLVSMTDPLCMRLEAVDVDEIEVFMTDPVCNRLEAVDVDEIPVFVRNPPHFLSSGLDFNKKNHEKHS
ncbi:unnamed protein product [Sphagnum tenellum]